MIIQSLWETAEIKPMVNQVLCHISNSPLELVDYCQKHCPHKAIKVDIESVLLENGADGKSIVMTIDGGKLLSEKWQF